MKKIALSVLLATLASTAFAADNTGFYAGVQVGSAKLDGISGRKTGFGGLVGYDFNPNVAVELGYNRLGSFKVSGVDFDANQTILSVVGTAPLGNGFSLFGRVGYNRLEGNASYGGYSASGSDNKAVFGAGVGYAFTPAVNARLEFQRPDSGDNTINLGVNFKF